MFDKGLSVSSIRFYRFTIASCHFGLKKKKIFEDGSTVSSSQVLSRFIRAFLLKRPRYRSLLPSWSLPAVLLALVMQPFELMH